MTRYATWSAFTLIAFSQRQNFSLNILPTLVWILYLSSTVTSSGPPNIPVLRPPCFLAVSRSKALPLERFLRPIVALSVI